MPFAIRIVVYALALLAMPVVAMAQTPAASEPVLPPGTNRKVEELLQASWKLEWSNRAPEAEADLRAAVEFAGKIQDPREKAELPRALGWQADFLRRQKRYPEALQAAETALREAEQRLGAADWHAGRAHTSVASILLTTGDHAKAEEHLRKAIALYAATPTGGDANDRAVAYLTLAADLNAQRRYAEAMEAQKMGLENQEKITPRNEAALAKGYLTLASFAEAQRNPDEIEAAFKTGTVHAVLLQGADRSIAVTLLLKQAAFYRTHKKFEEAWDAAERALPICEELYGKDRIETMKAHLELGTIALLQKDAIRARPQFFAILDSYNRGPSREAASYVSIAAFQVAVDSRRGKRPAEAEAMIRSAIGIRESVFPDDAANLAVYYQLLALTLADQRKIDAAEPTFHKAMELYAKAKGADSKEIANLNIWLGDALFDVGRYREAEQPGKKAVEILSKLDEPLTLSNAQVHLSVTYRYLQRFAEAETLVRAALATRQKLLPIDDPWVADAQYNLAAVLRWEGKYALAEPLFRRAFTVSQRAYGLYNQTVLSQLNGLALSLDGLGRFAEAEPLYREALAGRERVLGPDHEEVADTLVSLAWNLKRQERLDEAMEIAERPLEIYRSRLGPDHPYVLRGLLPLAQLAQERGEFDKAEAYYRDALRIRTKVFGPEDLSVAQSYGDLVKLFGARRQFEEAAGYASRMLKIAESKFGKDDPRIIPTMSIYANLQILSGELDAAEVVLRRTLQICEQRFGVDSLPVAAASLDLAYLYRMRGSFGDVQRFFERPLEIYEKKLGPTHPAVAVALVWEAQFRIAIGQAKEAQEAFDRALSIFATAYGSESPALAGPLNSKALLLIQLHRTDEAEQDLKRAIALLRKGTARETAALAGMLANLSLLYTQLGRVDEAKPLKEQATAIYGRIYGPGRIPPFVLSPNLPPPPQDL